MRAATSQYLQAIKMDPELPNEMVEKIVSNITDFHQLLKLRLVSRQWNEVIEYCLSRRRSLAIMDVDYVIYNQYSTLNDRFFRSLENERFILIQLRHFSAVFHMEFTQTVMRLFRRVQHFAFQAPLLTSHAVTCLFTMLNTWPNLSSLSLSIDSPRPNYHILISLAINSRQNLIRLDLGTRFPMSLLHATLARIHYLAVGFVESREQFLNMIREIGPHCKHLWIENWYDNEVVHSADIRQWIGENSAFFERLTHFGWPGKITDTGLAVIDQNFTSLTTWHVVKELRDVYVVLSWLSRLRELRVLHLSDPFRPIIVLADRIIESPSNVRTFELHDVFCSSDIAIFYWVELFVNELRLIYPNAQRIILTSPHRRTVEMLEQCVAGDQRFQILQSEAYQVWVRT